VCRNQTNPTVKKFRGKLHDILSKTPVDKYELFCLMRLLEKTPGIWQDFISSYDELKDFVENEYKVYLQADMQTLIDSLLKKMPESLEDAFEENFDEIQKPANQMKWGARQRQPEVDRSLTPDPPSLRTRNPDSDKARNLGPAPPRIRRAPGLMIKVDYGEQGMFDAIMIEDHGDGTYDVEYLDKTYPPETLDEAYVIFPKPKLKQPDSAKFSAMNSRMDLPSVSPKMESERAKARSDFPSPPGRADLPSPPPERRNARADLPSDKEDDSSSSEEEEDEFDRHSIQRRIEVLTLNNSRFEMNDLRRLCMLCFLQRYDEAIFQDELRILVERKILDDYDVVEMHEAKEFQPLRLRKPPQDVLEASQSEKVHNEASMYWLKQEKMFWDVKSLAECYQDDEIRHICGVFSILEEKLRRAEVATISDFVDNITSKGGLKKLPIKNKRLLKFLATKVLKAKEILAFLREQSEQDVKAGKVKGIITEIRADEYKEVQNGIDDLYVRMLEQRRYVEIPCKFLDPQIGLVIKYSLQKDKKDHFDNLSMDDKGNKWLTAPMSFKDKRLQLSIPPVYPTLEDCDLQDDVKATVQASKPKKWKKKKKQKYKPKR